MSTDARADEWYELAALLPCRERDNLPGNPQNTCEHVQLSAAQLLRAVCKVHEAGRRCIFSCILPCFLTTALFYFEAFTLCMHLLCSSSL